MLKTIISITKECQISLHCLLLLLFFFIIIMLWPQFPPLSREAVDEYKILGDRTKLILQKIMSKDASNEQSWTRL